MALGKSWRTRSEHADSVKNGLQFENRTRILGSKRVVVSNCMDASILSSPSFSTRKRRGRRVQIDRSNRLESLPQDILVGVLCKVNHRDLKQLLFVSKSVHGATLIARDSHFAFSTPSPKAVFNKDRDWGGEDSPSAPKRLRVAKSRIDRGKLAGIAVTLFASSADERWPKKDLAAET